MPPTAGALGDGRPPRRGRGWSGARRSPAMRRAAASGVQRVCPRGLGGSPRRPLRSTSGGRTSRGGGGEQGQGHAGPACRRRFCPDRVARSGPWTAAPRGWGTCVEGGHATVWARSGRTTLGFPPSRSTWPLGCSASRGGEPGGRARRRRGRSPKTLALRLSTPRGRGSSPSRWCFPCAPCGPVGPRGWWSAVTVWRSGVWRRRRVVRCGTPSGRLGGGSGGPGGRRGGVAPGTRSLCVRRARGPGRAPERAALFPRWRCRGGSGSAPEERGTSTCCCSPRRGWAAGDRAVVVSSGPRVWRHRGVRQDKLPCWPGIAA
jgi:hypothetical protein